MNNIDEQFKKLLDTADKVAECNDDQMTDEEVEEFFTQLAESTTDPAQLFPSNNGIEINENTDPSRNVQEQVLVSANPSTGVLTTIPYDSDNITEESIDELLNLKEEDLRKIELGWDAFVDHMKMMYPDATEEGLKQLFNLANRYRAGEKFPYFNELPDFAKNEINTYVNAGASQFQVNANTIKHIKNELAKELFDTIIANNYSSKAFKDLAKFTTEEINKEKDKLYESSGNYNTSMRHEYEVGFIEKAETLESSDEEGAAETAANLRKVSRMFTQSYTYEDMYETYKSGKIKVKNIQIDKFSRTCQEFNRKYYNSNFQIRDVGMTVPVLDRLLDGKYNMNAIQKFIVVFINYTKNFTPSNVDEHVFMYYFIQNILTLDIKLPGEENEQFNETIINNIHKFLDLIIERDSQKQEVKKGKKNNGK